MSNFIKISGYYSGVDTFVEKECIRFVAYTQHRASRANTFLRKCNVGHKKTSLLNLVLQYVFINQALTLGVIT